MALAPGAMPSALPLDLARQQSTTFSGDFHLPFAPRPAKEINEDTPLLDETRAWTVRPMNTASSPGPPEPAWQLFPPNKNGRRTRRRIDAATAHERDLERKRRIKESNLRYMQAIKADPVRWARFQARHKAWAERRRARDPLKWAEHHRNEVRTWRARRMAQDPDFVRREAERQRAYDNDPVNKARKALQNKRRREKQPSA